MATRAPTPPPPHTRAHAVAALLPLPGPPHPTSVGERKRGLARGWPRGTGGPITRPLATAGAPTCRRPGAGGGGLTVGHGQRSRARGTRTLRENGDTAVAREVTRIDTKELERLCVVRDTEDHNTQLLRLLLPSSSSCCLYISAQPPSLRFPRPLATTDRSPGGLPPPPAPPSRFLEPFCVPPTVLDRPSSAA
ncbi:hypothetical protein NL676_009333 [Syzygium grande]|nr:hypothetical protein NL676_009333 [Syzygium grande]